jgi:hypothetical protein
MTLREVYENAKTSTRNPVLLAKRAGTSVKSAKAFLATQASAAVRTAWRKPTPEQFAPAGGPAGHWQADTLFLDDYRGVNSKRRAILTLLNTTTRYAIARPLLNTQAATVSAAMEDILSSEKPAITVLRVDGGPEWGTLTQKFLKGRGIVLQMGEPNTHTWLARTDRFHRTLRQRLGEHFDRADTHRWIDALPDIVKNYNSSPHRTLSELLQRRASPGSITRKEERVIRADELQRAANLARKTDSIGIIPGETYVRVLRQKTREGGRGAAFNKGQASAWSRDIYLVVKRSGVNSFVVDVPTGEVKIWPLHSLLVVSHEEEKTAAAPGEKVDVKIAKAKRLEARNISEEEQAVALKGPARRKRVVKRPARYI